MNFLEHSNQRPQGAAMSFCIDLDAHVSVKSTSALLKWVET